MIKFRCSCGKKLGVPDEKAGSKVKCPGCGQKLEIPSQSAEDEVPAPRKAAPPPPEPDEDEEEEHRAKAPARSSKKAAPPPPEPEEEEAGEGEEDEVEEKPATRRGARPGRGANPGRRVPGKGATARRRAGGAARDEEEPAEEEGEEEGGRPGRRGVGRGRTGGRAGRAAGRAGRRGAGDPGRAEEYAKRSLIFGILGLVLCGPVFGPLAIVQANKARRIDPGQATAGLVLGWIATIGAVVAIVLSFVFFATLMAFIAGSKP